MAVASSRSRRATSQKISARRSANWEGRRALLPASTPMTGDAEGAEPVDAAGPDACAVHEDGVDAESVGPRLHLVGHLHVVEASLKGDEALDAVAAPDADDGLVGAEACDVDAHAVREAFRTL